MSNVKKGLTAVMTAMLLVVLVGCGPAQLPPCDDQLRDTAMPGVPNCQE